MIDTTNIEVTDDDEVQADENNQPLIGATATLDWKPNLDLGCGAWLSLVGTMRCRGRIWVGARHAAKREELEARIFRMFFDEPEAPGRWLFDIPEPVVGDYTLPCPWTATAIVGDSTWTAEYAFAERLWAWLSFELELSLLVPRDDPRQALIKKFIFGFDVHVDQPIDDSDPDDVKITDLDGGADNEYYTGYPPKKVADSWSDGFSSGFGS
jgi:hypothetical protein